MCNPNPSTPGFLPTGSSWREETLGLLSRDLSAGRVPAAPGHGCCLQEPPCDRWVDLWGRWGRWRAWAGVCAHGPGSLSPSRDSLEPSPGVGLLNSAGTSAEGAVLVFGGWVLIPRSLPLQAQAGGLRSRPFAPCRSYSL